MTTTVPPSTPVATATAKAGPSAPPKPAGRRPPAASPTDRDVTLFVWGTWAVLVVAALGYVAVYGHNVPYIDDWAIIPYLTGDTPVTLDYLWEQHNEHRIPVPKAVLLTLYRLSGGDFRAGMYFNVLVLAALAFAFLHLARRLHGRTAYTDALLPLVLLHWGHYETILWDFEIQLVLSTALVCVLLMLVLRGEAALTPRRGVLFGVCLLLLPLCGAQGLPYVLLLASWLAWVAWRHRLGRDDADRRVAAAWLALAAGAVLLVGLNYAGYENHPGSYFSVPDPTVQAHLRTSLEFLSTALGPAAAFVWPFGAAAVVLVGLLSAGLLLRVLRAWPAEWTRPVGLLLFLAATAGLAFGVGKGRAGDANAASLGFEPRYTTLMAPTLCAVYFLWGLYAPRAVGRLARTVLFALAASVLMENTAEAVKNGRTRWTWEQGLLDAVQQGAPLCQLTRNFSRALTYELDQTEFARRLQMLKDGKVGPYRRVQDDPKFLEVPVPLTPMRVSEGMTWNEDGTGQVRDADAHLDFALPQLQWVAGIRLTVQYHDHPAAGCPLPRAWKNDLRSELCPRLRLNWKTDQQWDFVGVEWWKYTDWRWQEERFLSPEPGAQTLTIWVADTIDRFRVYPDFPRKAPTAHERYARWPARYPFTFSVSNITLLVPGG